MQVNHLFATGKVKRACLSKIEELDKGIEQLEENQARLDKQLDAHEFEAIKQFKAFDKHCNKKLREREIKAYERKKKRKQDLIKDANEAWKKKGVFGRLFYNGGKANFVSKWMARDYSYLHTIEESLERLNKPEKLIVGKNEIDNFPMPKGFFIKPSSYAQLCAGLITHMDFMDDVQSKEVSSCSCFSLRRENELGLVINARKDYKVKAESILRDLDLGQDYVQLDDESIKLLFDAKGETNDSSAES